MKVLINSLRLYMLLFKRFCTPKSQHFEKYATPANVFNRLPKDAVIVLQEQAWSLSFSDGITTGWGDNLDKNTSYYPKCSFNYIDQEKLVVEQEIMRMGLDRCAPNIYGSKDRVLTLSMNYAYQRNYFHWLFDVLPRIYIAESAGHVFDQVYACTEKQFQRDSLEILGFTEQDCIAMQEHSIVQAKTLIVTSVPNAFRDMPEWVVSFLRQRLKPALLASNSQIDMQSRKLFVSREDAVRRKALNEIELEEYLINKGFIKVIPSLLSIKQQAYLFANADFVVGTHGAALANLVFCEPGTKVLEIVAPKFQWKLFSKLASQVQLEYRMVAANSSQVAGDEFEKFENQHTDFVIDFNHISADLDWVAG